MKQTFFIPILILAFSFSVFAQTSENSCPQVNLRLPLKLIQYNIPTNFSVEFGNEFVGKFEYIWTVSRGEIISGQGTSKIEFLAGEENSGTNVTVSIKIKGLPENCTDTVSDIAVIEQLIEGDPVDSFGKLKSTTEGFYGYLSTLDNFMVSLQNSPASEGLILIQFNSADSREYKISRLRKTYKHFVFRDFNPARITFVVSQSGEEETSLWVVPPGAEFPKSVEKEYKIIKAENLEQELKDLFKNND